MPARPVTFLAERAHFRPNPPAIRSFPAILNPVIRDARIGKPLTDLMVLNASFLVGRAMLPKFDRTLEIATRETRDRMTFDCVGPLPPFSFVDLRL